MARILVVDDEMAFREALHHTFNKRGHEVMTAMNTDHASSLMASNTFDIIILDLLMPGELGTVLLMKVRASGNRIPVVIYSVKVDATIEKEMRQAGANEVLHKSVSLEVLADRTETVLRSSGRLSHGLSEGKKRLLVVDDDVAVRRTLVLFFGRKGYEVMESSSGEDAVDRIGSQVPDIVLLDMHMGGMDGLQTLKKIRQIQPKLPIVMATGDENDEMVREAMEHGAYGYVLKPFDFLYLELVVASKLSIAQTPGRSE